ANVVAPNQGSNPDELGASVSLRAALNSARNTGGSATINLSNTTYTLNTVDNYWYGPDGLPAISSDVTINGNGAVITRHTSGPNFRSFFASGSRSGLPAGSLTLNTLTLQNGLAQGGSSASGGGGLGAGGAIFNMGLLNLNGVTLTQNTAHGGDSQV